MSNPHEKIFAKIGIIFDVIMTIIAFMASYYIKKDLLPEPFSGLAVSPNYQTVLFLIIIVWYPLIYTIGIHKLSYRTSYFDISADTFKVIVFGIVLVNFMLYILKIFEVSRLLLLIFCILNFISLTMYKVILIYWRRKWRRKEYNLTNILFIGCNLAGSGVIYEVVNNLSGEYKIVGCLVNGKNPDGLLVAGENLSIGDITDLEYVLKTYVVDEIVISTPMHQIKDMNKYLKICEDSGAVIRILPDWGVDLPRYKSNLGMRDFSFFCGTPALTIDSTKNESNAILFKYALDYVLAFAILIITLPVLLIIVIAIKLGSTGPVFYVQERVGLYGRKFDMYKFRTMVVNADALKYVLNAINESDGPAFKIKNDPRIIPYIGKLLRKTGLDELPQLINVLKGDMSLVGPRPPVKNEVLKYDFWQRRRLSMKPGISCLWQVNPNRIDIPFKDWMRMDLEYIDNWSLSLDLKIILKTIFTILRAQGR